MFWRLKNQRFNAQAGGQAMRPEDKEKRTSLLDQTSELVNERAL